MNQLLLFLLLLFSFPDLFAQAPADHRAGELLVQLRPGSGLAGLRTAYPAFRVKKAISPDLGIYLLTFEVQPREEKELLGRLQSHPDVAVAQFNRKVRLRDTRPNDQLYSEQWHMEIINAPAIWDFTTGGLTATGDTIVVAILDGGFDDRHEDLVPNLWRNPGEIAGDGIDNDGNGYVDDLNGWNVKNNNNIHITDINNTSHGTSTAGLVGARGENGSGITGVNWKVKLMLLSGTEFEDEIVEAYLYAYEMRKKYNLTDGREGAFVVATNFSLGIDEAFAEEFPLWCGVYNRLGEEGILSVGATSNRNVDVDNVGDMPSTCISDFLIVATNTDEQDHKAERAGVGRQSIDLGAPGHIAFTTKPDNDYGKFPGTSASAPHVAGAIALLYSLPADSLARLSKNDPAATALLIKQFILNGAEPIEDLKGVTVSEGRLDLLNSLELMRDYFGSTTDELQVIRFFPNPARERIRVLYETPDFEAYEMRVYNALGQELLRRQVNPQQFSQKFEEIDLSGWTKGMYFVSFRQGKEIASGQFMVW